MATDVEITFTRLHLSMRFKDVLFPFEQSLFLRYLPELGYSISGQIRQVLPPLGGHLEVKGVIATKGADIRVAINPENPSLGIAAPDCGTLVDTFEEVEAALRERLHLNSEEHALFYEVDARATVHTGSNPTAVLRKHAAPKAIVAGGEALFGEPCANATFRLVPTTGSASSADWFDLIVEPFWGSPETFYVANLVFRNSDRQRVVGLARELAPKLEQFVETLEAR